MKPRPSASKRYVLYPIQEGQIWDLYKAAESAFWTPGKYLSTTETRMVNSADIQAILASIICHHNHTLLNPLAVIVDSPEAKVFLNYQAMIQEIDPVYRRQFHVEFYVGMLQHSTMGKYPGTMEGLLAASETSAINKMRDSWLKSHTAPSNDVLERLVATACSEALFFSSFSAVTSVLWDERIPGSPHAALRKIRADKALTTQFLLLLYRRYTNTCSVYSARLTIQEAVDIEISTINSLPFDAFNIDPEILIQDLRSTAADMLSDFEFSGPVRELVRCYFRTRTEPSQIQGQQREIVLRFYIRAKHSGITLFLQLDDYQILNEDEWYAGERAEGSRRGLSDASRAMFIRYRTNSNSRLDRLRNLQTLVTRMGRRTLTYLIAQELEILDRTGRPSRHRTSDPFRPLARTLAARQYHAQRLRQIIQLHQRRDTSDPPVESEDVEADVVTPVIISHYTAD
ncbi:hypothetical protein DFH09DRAFT_1113085 [Mycena vulgaris]|nr:hypothetical protein DFH09DRAFT_1113085 [Mycena vulgaris]